MKRKEKCDLFFGRYTRDLLCTYLHTFTLILRNVKIIKIEFGYFLFTEAQKCSQKFRFTYK